MASWAERAKLLGQEMRRRCTRMRPRSAGRSRARRARSRRSRHARAAARPAWGPATTPRRCSRLENPRG